MFFMARDIDVKLLSSQKTGVNIDERTYKLQRYMSVILKGTSERVFSVFESHPLLEYVR